MNNTLLYYQVSLKNAPESVSDLSSLTRVQVETVKTHLALVKGEITMDIALKIRKTSGISRGTHYRILHQAKENIVESLLTVATAAQLGLLKQEDVQKLIATVSTVPVELDPNKVPEVVGLVRALAERIVML
jgi:hypothetical protein